MIQRFKSWLCEPVPFDPVPSPVVAAVVFGVIVILALSCAPPMAADDPIPKAGGPGLMVAPLPCHEYPQVPPLAARLGIPKLPDERPYTVAFLFKMCNGDAYDFFAMVNALLDRMDGGAAK